MAILAYFLYFCGVKSDIIIIDKGYEFIRPYVRAALPAGTVVHTVFPADEAPSLAVMLSSTDVYSPGAEVVLAGEGAAVAAGSPWAKAESDFVAAANAAGARAVILRCAPVVATGMQGFVRSLAADIWRGVFFHFPGNETRLSVVHATDIAAVIGRILAGGLGEGSAPAVFNLTDGVNPTLHDLAEALAHRMDEKRISNLSTRPQQLIARFLYGPKYRTWTTERTFDGSAICRALDYTTTPVCEYLRTHVYDEQSL